MAAYITVGAKTTHGGTVISGSPHTTHNGIPVARKGDKVSCKKCKKIVTIATGDPSFIIDDSPIARAGDITSCGSKLIANQLAFAESDFSVGGVERIAEIILDKKQTDASEPNLFSDIFQLVDELTNEPLKDMEYLIEHAEGQLKGKTNKDGFMEELTLSNAFEVLIKIPFHIDENTIDYKVFKHSLSPAGSSGIKPIKLPTKRTLTAGEINLAKLVFKNSINYSQVFIHDSEFLPFGLQNNNTVMTPNGNLYYPKKHYRADFSTESNAYKRLFIHEMVHVWQYQLGYSVKWNGIWLHIKDFFGGPSPYPYVLDPVKKLSDYNMEQQGDIIADYFVYYVLKLTTSTGLQNAVSVSGLYYRYSKSKYLTTLSKFLNDPNNTNNLPN